VPYASELPTECGAGGLSCGPCPTTGLPPNSGAACSGGACGYACSTGYTACNAGGSAPACLLANPDTNKGVFVAPGGAGGACGSESQPCGTIAEALTVIGMSSGTKTIIYLANGTYTEQVTLVPGITIQGGWLDSGGSWTHLCTATPQTGAVIQAPAGAISTVNANFAAAGTSTLDTLTIQSLPSASPGQSLYGVMATGGTTTLVLNDVDINVAAAGGGPPGGVGSAGTPGASGACTTQQDGANGPPGAAGPGAPPGLFLASGYSPANGTGGKTNGGNGDNGGPPAPPACTTVTSCDDDGNGNCVSTNPSCCNTSGSCGNGGAGGGPGGPGQGGGSSVGVYTWGAVVTITGAAITTGTGGNGGPGGPGGPGGSGAQGPLGAAGKYAASCHQHCIGSVCACIGNTPLATCEPAGLGSTGGTGGTGGGGGGGAGGYSYCWYIGPGSVVNASTTACTPGGAGSGGGGGAAGGASGTHN